MSRTELFDSKSIRMAKGFEILRMPKKSDEKPWKKPAPKKSRHTKLTPKSKKKAKAAAKRAGRKYPNLVDNMQAGKKQRSRKRNSKP